jgi:diguanylate cyclase (GGDEF)-like protein
MAPPAKSPSPAADPSGPLLALGVAVVLLAAASLALILAPPAAWARMVVPAILGGALLLILAHITLLARLRGGTPGQSAPSAPVRPEKPEVGQQLQALAAGSSDEVGALMREFTRILEILQEQASQVQDYAGRFEAINEELRNANLRLRELSLTDELTEVGNRRNFDVRMREEINRSTRFGHGFSLLLLDIDKFKKFNDDFGHPQGDTALRALGALMRSMSREGDVPCRIGGEEFAFILPETAKGDATLFAERMRRGVEAGIKAPDGRQPITVSIGLAAFPEDGKSPDDLVRAADEALYESKHAGRNRVTAYSRK